jgi:hypothetical protein
MEFVPIDITTIIVTFITVVFSGGIIGLFALFRSNKKLDEEEQNDRDAQAQAAANMIGAADDVVRLVREEMAKQMESTNERISVLEETVTAWDGWADRVLEILDRAVGLLSEEQRSALLPDIDHARETRPPRYHHFRAKRILHKEDGT